MATPTFAVRRHAAASPPSSHNGTTAIDVDVDVAYESTSDVSPFVIGSAARTSPMLDDDDELLDDAEHNVCRSASQFGVVFTPVRDSDYYAGDATPEFVANPVTASTWHREPPVGRKVAFSSIAEDFPLAATSKAAVVVPIRPTSYRPCGVEAAVGVATPRAPTATESPTTGARAGGYSISGRVTPVMNVGQGETTEPEVMTLLCGSKSRERDSDDDRKSPFGDTVLQSPKVYQYRATKTEIDDMEVCVCG